MEEINVSAAIRMYTRHKESMQKYQRSHPEKGRESTERYITKMKLENPERYESIKLKNRERYQQKKITRKEQKNEKVI